MYKVKRNNEISLGQNEISNALSKNSNVVKDSSYLTIHEKENGVGVMSPYT